MAEVGKLAAICGACGADIFAAVSTKLTSIGGGEANIEVTLGPFTGCTHASAVAVRQCEEPESLLGVTPPEPD